MNSKSKEIDKDDSLIFEVIQKIAEKSTNEKWLTHGSEEKEEEEDNEEKEEKIIQDSTDENYLNFVNSFAKKIEIEPDDLKVIKGKFADFQLEEPEKEKNADFSGEIYYKFKFCSECKKGQIFTRFQYASEEKIPKCDHCKKVVLKVFDYNMSSEKIFENMFIYNGECLKWIREQEKEDDFSESQLEKLEEK